MPNTEINFSEHYTVDGYQGVAFYLRGYATETVEVQITDEFDGGPVYFYEHETVEIAGSFAPSWSATIASISWTWTT